MPTEPPKPPFVETSPDGNAQAETGQHALGLRVRQQEILAELGVTALKGTAFEELLDLTVRRVAEGLEAELAKVLEYMPAEKRLLMRAGVGWDPGLVGRATIGADLESPSGFALRTGKPVISNHLENEERFRTPELLAAHGVRRAMNVILQGDGAPYGILEVDSRSEGEFTEHDIAFLQGAANILGMAIERQRRECKLNEALELQQVLIKEINHRVKNSLQLVSSMLSLQAGADPRVAESLQDASLRVAAIARAHDRLYRSAQVHEIDLAEYLRDVCGDLSETTPHCDVECDSPEPILMSTDRAIRVALMVTELATNSPIHKGNQVVSWSALPVATGRPPALQFGTMAVACHRTSSSVAAVAWVGADGRGSASQFGRCRGGVRNRTAIGSPPIATTAPHLHSRRKGPSKSHRRRLSYRGCDNDDREKSCRQSGRRHREPHDVDLPCAC